MVNHVAGCQPPAGATPLLWFGLPSLPGVVGMVLAPRSASGKHSFYVVCGYGPYLSCVWWVWCWRWGVGLWASGDTLCACLVCWRRGLCMGGLPPPSQLWGMSFCFYRLPCKPCIAVPCPTPTGYTIQHATLQCCATEYSRLAGGVLSGCMMVQQARANDPPQERSRGAGGCRTGAGRGDEPRGPRPPPPPRVHSPQPRGNRLGRPGFHFRGGGGGR